MNDLNKNCHSNMVDLQTKIHIKQKDVESPRVIHRGN